MGENIVGFVIVLVNRQTRCLILLRSLDQTASSSRRINNWPSS